MDTALVTGAGGFLGRHLCPSLAKCFRVVAVDMAGVEPVPQTEWIIAEQRSDLARTVFEVRPSIVIHAAFINRKPVDLSDAQYINNILSVDLPLFEAMANTEAKLLLISSSAVYGYAGQRKIIDESCQLKPVSIYGLGKSIQETTAQYCANQGLKVCILRPFNFLGPGQKPGMLIPDWIKKVTEIAAGKGNILKVRHRKTSRDFVDVRDASKAIVLVASDFSDGEIYNISSGKSLDLMDISLELQRLCPIPMKIEETEPDLHLPDVPFQRGSFKKIHSRYGWKPRISWRDSLKDIWDSYNQ